MSHLINELKQAAQGNSEILEFIEGPIRARLEGKNPRYAVPNQTEVEHVVDYLVNRARKDKKLKLKKASYEQMVQKSHEWVDRLKKKADGIVELETDVELVKAWPTGMRLVKLVGENAYKREGKMMSHCVSSYFDSSNSSIYSLRDSNNNPHCTMEVTSDGDNVQQIKGKGNGSIHPKYINYIIDVLKEFNVEVREYELNNLGYQALDDKMWQLIDYGFKGARELTLGGKRYFYKDSKLECSTDYEKLKKWAADNILGINR